MQAAILMLTAVVTAFAGAAEQASAAASAPRAVVRVNQVGYRPGDAKRAVLLSMVSEAGARFAVVNANGRTILRGRVGAALPAWSGRYRFARAIDFSAAGPSAGPTSSSPARRGRCHRGFGSPATRSCTRRCCETRCGSISPSGTGRT